MCVHPMAGAYFSAIGLKILALYPQPNGSYNNGTQNYFNMATTISVVVHFGRRSLLRGAPWSCPRSSERSFDAEKSLESGYSLS